MPYIKDKNLINIYEEVDKANETINKLNQMLTEDKENISILKKHRFILGTIGFLALILFLWSFMNKPDKPNQDYLKKNNLALINLDSLGALEDAALTAKIDTLSNELIDDASSIAGETIVYSIQIGAFTNFKARLFSDDLAHMKEYKEGGLNKYAIGNFISYAEAIVLKDDLQRLGFKDCFVIAQSYGETVNIREALELSEETQYLN